MKLISILLIGCLLSIGGCINSETDKPINSNPSAEQEMENNDSYVPWWAVKPSATNGVITNELKNL